MYLIGSRRKRLSLKVSGTSSRPPITDERADELFDAIENHDPAAINEFVDGMLRTAIKIAAEYSAIDPKNSDEIVSRAMSGLLRGIKTVQNKEITNRNIKAVCVYAVHSECAKASDAQQTFGPTRRTQKRNPKSVVHAENFESLHLANTRDSRLADVLEIVPLVLDSEQQTIFAMLREGYEQQEIATRLGISEFQVCRSWKAAKAALMTKLEQDENS